MYYFTTSLFCLEVLCKKSDSAAVRGSLAVALLHVLTCRRSSLSPERLQANGWLCDSWRYLSSSPAGNSHQELIFKMELHLWVKYDFLWIWIMSSCAEEPFSNLLSFCQLTANLISNICGAPSWTQSNKGTPRVFLECFCLIKCILC